MMMPANYSAIAENEMAYVVGGGLADILPEKMGTAQWQRFATNLVTIVGNTALSGFIKGTVGAIFGGTYYPGLVGVNAANAIKGAYNTGSGAVNPDTKYEGWNNFVKGANGVLNSGLKIVSGMAAIYNLGTANVKNAAEKDGGVTIDG